MTERRYVMIFVSDLDRSIRFYRDVLRLTVQSEGHAMVGYGDPDGFNFALAEAV